ncbi:MAG TPA: PH domain-containing protein [Anaerohalosphaeraceae bacterium]|nr:PH domain-containing protein [Anaerohalosphaeraceae bacterium]HOL88191.1 PH domain-containing protein [Anaerohalosphaeraceae bacterium]HPP56050.1 PH domain-containing protein [Anaerohalosphaeraceae bacterium]
MERERKTKPCPFCGEEILADAVKCRWCREFLTEDENALPTSHHAGTAPSLNRAAPRPAAEAAPKSALPAETLSVRPSLWEMAGTFFAAVLFAALGICLMVWPFEKYLSDPSRSQPSVQTVLRAADWAGAVILLVAVMRAAYRVLYLKSIFYQISPDRIEWNRGIFNRKVDNIDMFRVIDIKLRRSLMDCLLGIGKITLMTRDETDPVFEFEKIRRPREVYDYIKAASLAADRKQGVVHLE